jgi:putative aldouronate transport system permease protein
MKKLNNEKVYQILITCIIITISIVCLFPLVYVFMLSLTSKAEWIDKEGVIFWVNNPTLFAYKGVFKFGGTIGKAFVISILRTTTGTFLTLIITIISGYTLSRKDLPGRKIMIIMVMTILIFNGGLIPTYLVVKGTNLLDTFWAMIVPMMMYGWGVLIFKQFFENIPAEIEESAQMDGASEINLMINIAVPISAPVIAAIGLFSAVIHWNSWFDAMIYITDPGLKPLQLVLRNMFVDNNLSWATGTMNHDPSMLSVTDESQKMAVAIIGTIPILMVYPFLQKHFVKGVYTGSVKG